MLADVLDMVVDFMFPKRATNSDSSSLLLLVEIMGTAAAGDLQELEYDVMILFYGSWYGVM